MSAWSNTDYRHGQSEDWETRWKDCLSLKTEIIGGLQRLTRIEGSCPSCGHRIHKLVRPIEDGVIAFAADSRNTPLPDRAGVYLVTCNCVYAHQNAPDGVRGCGAQGTLRVTPLADGGALLEYAETTADQRDVDEWFEAATSRRLTRIREMATQWSTMLGVVTGFVAFGAIFDAGDASTVVSTGRWKPYLALTAIALAAALAAIVCGALAGGLHHVQVLPRDLDGRATAYAGAKQYAERRLLESRICSVIAVSALAAALIVRFW